jgi:hypothetical protein
MCGIAGLVARQPLGEARARSVAHAVAEHAAHEGLDVEPVWSVAEGCRARCQGGHGGRRCQ